MKLLSTLDTSQAASLHQMLLEAPDDELSIDAGDVRFLGTACLQVLIAHQRDRGLAIRNPSQAFAEQWALAGAPSIDGMGVNS